MSDVSGLDPAGAQGARPPADRPGMAVEAATLMRIAELRAALSVSTTAAPSATAARGFSDLLQVALIAAIADRPEPIAPSAAMTGATPPPLPTQPVPASALTSTAPSAIPPQPYSTLSGDLDADPELLARLDRLAASRGEQWTVTSGLRTDAEQAALWANRASNPFPVAPPGTSVHRDGRGADVTIGGRPIQDVIPAEQLRAAGIEPLAGDAVHVQLPDGAGPTAAGSPSDGAPV